MNIILLDATFLLHRILRVPEFFSLEYNNTPTGGIFGYAKTLQTIFSTVPPSDKIIAVWDNKRSIRRKTIDPEYKENRTPKTDLDKQISEQFFKSFGIQKKIIKERLLPSLGVLSVELDGREGDDLIYIITQLYAKNSIVVVSEDRDILQLINVFPTLKVFRPIKNEVVTLQNFKECTGVDPKAFLLYKALMGDKSDNIKNIEGVGESTVIKLINQIDLDKQIESLMQITKAAYDACMAKKGQVLNREAKIYKSWSTIAHNLELMDLSREDFTNQEVMNLVLAINTFKREIHTSDFMRLCQEFGFTSILQDFNFFLLPFKKGLPAS